MSYAVTFCRTGRGARSKLRAVSASGACLVAPAAGSGYVSATLRGSAPTPTPKPKLAGGSGGASPAPWGPAPADRLNQLLAGRAGNAVVGPAGATGERRGRVSRH